MQSYFWTINLFFKPEKKILQYHISTQSLKSFNEMNYHLKNYVYSNLDIIITRFKLQSETINN